MGLSSSSSSSSTTACGFGGATNILCDPCHPLTDSPPKASPANERSIDCGCSNGDTNVWSKDVRCGANEDVNEEVDARDVCCTGDACDAGSTGLIGGETTDGGTLDNEGALDNGGETIGGGDGFRSESARLIVSSSAVGILSRKPGDRGEVASGGSVGVWGSGTTSSLVSILLDSRGSSESSYA